MSIEKKILYFVLKIAEGEWSLRDTMRIVKESEENVNEEIMQQSGIFRVSSWSVKKMEFGWQTTPNDKRSEEIKEAVYPLPYR